MQPMEMSGHRSETFLGRGARLLEDYKMRRGMVFGAMIVGAMLAFELFNYSTTDFALNNLLGDLRFVGIRWATILAVAFCGIDFAGIARLFTPEKDNGEHTEVWYLLAAWFLAATMNAMLTWWGVSLALLGHAGLGNEILGRETLLSAVPIFVSVLVWVIRILLIGMLSMAGNKLFSQVEGALRNQDDEADADERFASKPARMPTAAWTGSSTQRPTRIIGAKGLDDEYTVNKPQTVAERHGYGGRTQPQAAPRPVAPPPPAGQMRSAPKPANQPQQQPARKPVMAGNGGGNGHSHGNGHHNGNGNNPNGNGPTSHSYHGLDED